MARLGFLGACLGLVLLAGSARADVTFEYVTDQSSYVAAPGSTVTVSVLLQETVTGGSSSLLASEGGLYSGAFYLKQSSNPSNPSTITGASANPAFAGDFSGRVSSTQVRLAEDNFNGTSGVTGTVNGNTTTVLLGTVSIQLPNQAYASTTYTVEAYKFAPKGFGGSGTDGNTLSWNSFYDLDVTNNNGMGNAPPYTGADSFNDTGTPFPAFTFTVTTTPEPGSLALGTVAASGLALGAWRRWRKTTRRAGA